MRARPYAPQERFELGERLFDGRQVGRVGGQPEDLAPPLLDGVAHAFPGVGTQVIQDDDLAGLERGSQHLFHVGLKDHRVHGALQDTGRLHPFKREPSNQGRVLAPVAGHRPRGPLTPGCAGVERRESDMSATFIDKDQALDRQVGDQVVPGRAGDLIALGSTQCLFLRVQPRRAIARLILAVLTRTLWLASHSWQCCSRVASS